MSRYNQVIEKVFFDNYNKGDVRVTFKRQAFVKVCQDLGLDQIKNLGDIPYSYRFRKELPDSIKETAPANSEWIIIGSGIALYEFRQASPGKIQPSANRLPVPVPDSTPEIVKHYSPGTDEQALLTRVRYNRLVDLFTGLTCYSVQNHLRTTVENIGQIEVDEIYLGIHKKGTHFVLPCQAKSSGDRFGIVQVIQDISFCESKYPETICKPIALQFLGADDVAIVELAITEQDDVLKLNVVDEKHFKLIPRSEIDRDALLKLKQEHD